MKNLKSRNYWLLVALAVLVSSVIGCGSDDGASASGSFNIVGTWEVAFIEGAPPVDGSNSTWTFNADGSYEWFLLLPPFDISGGGDYNLTGTTLTCDGVIASLYGGTSTSLALTISNNNNTFSMLDPNGDRWTYNRAQ